MSDEPNKAAEFKKRVGTGFGVVLEKDGKILDSRGKIKVSYRILE